MADVKESDWKLFRARLPQWQERYMTGVVEKCRRILETETKASDCYWKLERFINREKRSPGVIVHDIRRSTMHVHILDLLETKVITLDDMGGFSEEYRAFVEWCCRVQRGDTPIPPQPKAPGEE